MNLIALLIKSKDFETTTTSTSKQAYKLIMENNYDLVISDIALPDMNGIDLFLKVKENLNPYPDFFVISGHSKYSKQKLLEYGIKGFYMKPDDINKKIDDADKIRKQKESKKI